MGKREAVEATLTKNFISVLTSGLILSAAGFCLNFSSSLSVVAALGTLLCRGTLLSMAMVLLALPVLILSTVSLSQRNSSSGSAKRLTAPSVLPCYCFTQASAAAKLPPSLGPMSI